MPSGIYDHSNRPKKYNREKFYNIIVQINVTEYMKSELDKLSTETGMSLSKIFRTAVTHTYKIKETPKKKRL